mgnify:CR=1 FL=1
MTYSKPNPLVKNSQRTIFNLLLVFLAIPAFAQQKAIPVFENGEAQEVKG